MMFDVLVELLGIGCLMVVVIVLFVYGVCVMIFDGNVKCVFVWVFGVEGFLGEKCVENDMWVFVELLLFDVVNVVDVSVYM